jgi:hypothetical protein
MKAFVLLALFTSVVSFSATSAFANGGAWSFGLGFAPGEAYAPVPPGMSLQKMLTLTSDRDANVYVLHLMQDNRTLNPTGMFVEQKKSASEQEDPANPDVVDGKAFLLAEIEKPAGVALFEAQGRKVLILQGALNPDTQEGRLKLKYLVNGLWMTYETCDVLLRKTDAEFWVQNAYTGTRITSVKIVTSTFGVVTLEGICPAKGALVLGE